MKFYSALFLVINILVNNVAYGMDPDTSKEQQNRKGQKTHTMTRNVFGNNPKLLAQAQKEIKEQAEEMERTIKAFILSQTKTFISDVNSMHKYDTVYHDSYRGFTPQPKSRYKFYIAKDELDYKNAKLANASLPKNTLLIIFNLSDNYIGEAMFGVQVPRNADPSSVVLSERDFGSLKITYKDLNMSEEHPSNNPPPAYRLTKVCEKCSTNIDIKLCSGCRKVYYCSKACQKEHWRYHKEKCQANKQT